MYNTVDKYNLSTCLLNDKKFIFKNKKAIDSKIIEKSLDVISKEIDTTGIRREYNICVLNNKDYFLLQITTAKTSNPYLINIQDIQLLSYENAKREISDVPNRKEDFINDLKKLTLIEIKQNSCSSKSLNIPPCMILSWKENPTIKNRENLNEWIAFANTVFTKNDTGAKVSIIQELQFGRNLNACAKLLNSIPLNEFDESSMPVADQIVSLSVSMIEEMTRHFFFESKEWKGMLGGLRYDSKSAPHYPKVKEIVNHIYENEVFSNKTIVTAWDSFEGQLAATVSGRMVAVNKNVINSLIGIRKSCQNIDKKSEFKTVHFPKLVINEFSAKLLINIADQLVEFGELHQVNPKFLNDQNKIMGDFIHLLFVLHQTRTKALDKKIVMLKFQRLFDKMLPPEIWDDLLNYFQSEKHDQKEFLNIFKNFCPSRTQLVMMSLANLCCGEMKIAIDRCTKLGRLSSEERQNCPETLGERLFFSAHHPHIRSSKQIAHKGKLVNLNNREFVEMDICQKCHELWPIMEALYRSIKISGLDISEMEKLSKFKRNLPPSNCLNE